MPISQVSLSSSSRRSNAPPAVGAMAQLAVVKLPPAAWRQTVSKRPLHDAGLEQRSIVESPRRGLLKPFQI